MATQTTQALDPRLRRLVASLDDERRLRRDLDQSLVTTAEATPSEAVAAPENLRARVLVQVGSTAPVDAVPDTAWIQVVDGIYSVDVPILALTDLAASPDVQFVEAPRLLTPLLDASMPETRADEVHDPPAGGPGLRGAGVIVGIVDFGLDFTHDDFIDEEGRTRVAFLWDQSLQPRTGERSPAGFGYGVEYSADDINGALATNDPFAVVRHRPEPASHGTHVAGIAAGNGRAGDAQSPAGRFIGAAPEATIIFVQPNATDAQTTFTDSTRVAEAVAYVFGKATELGMPCVINMSLGQNGGSHDGESIVERAIDRLLEQPGRTFVAAAGNEHIWRGHAGGRLADGEVRTLSWRAGGQLPLPGGGQLPAGGGDRTPNELEIWYSSRDRFDVRLIAPDGAATPVIAPGQTELLDDVGGRNQVFVDSERLSLLNGDARIYVEVSPGGDPRVQVGVWKVELSAVDAADGGFDAWIERDARDALNRFADQSFFVGLDFDGQRTLGTPATGRRTVAVANYDHVTVAPNDSSSRGPTRDGRTKPEVAAPGTNIVASGALGGRPADGAAAHPVRVAKTGTSMSAPHVAGIAALLLQHRPNLTAAQIRAALIAGATPPAGVVPFDAAWGFGRVDAAAALEALS